MALQLSRRSILMAGAAALARPLRAAQAPATPPLFDHVQLGCNDLDKGIDFVAEKLGVRAAFGGAHPGRGSRNALLSLGERRYLEILAPDPEQPPVNDARQLRMIAAPRLIGWAVHVDNIEAIEQRLREARIAFEPVRDGSRKRPSGEFVRWRALSLRDDQRGLLPFYIEWGKDSPHPSRDAPPGCRLESFELLFADEVALQKRTEQMGVEVAVTHGSPAGIHAVFAGPKGKMLL
jgi:hypothetical protein